ncbi:MAG: MBL fold metallo-hydrolase [Dehalococcoidia bacterium]|nr:MBL fold metallo-hydrolase [Dehalococcoidia bacterium]
MTSARLDDRTELPVPVLEEVSPGVFAYLQPDGSWGLNNTGFVVGPDAVTVVDTCFTERRSRAFVETIRKVTDRPPAALINTHSHGDHTHGNVLFAPATAIIASERCRREMIAAGHSTLALFPGVDWGNIPVTPPFVTFEDRLNVYAGDLRIELTVMAPAHTTNDVVAWIPERGVLFAGDLVFNGGTPFALAGSVAGWLEAIARLRSLGADTIVPGHGPVAGPAVLDDVEAYLRFVEEVAHRGFEAGQPPLQVARGAGLGAFAHWHDRERLVANIHRVYSELRGEPLGTRLDYGQIFDEMLAFNGGQPLRCLA